MVYPYYLGNPQIGIITQANFCADDQDKFFEYREAIYHNIDRMNSESGLMSIASEVEGLNVDALSACLSSGKYASYINSGRAAATRQGVSSTPTFFINGQKVEGNQPYDLLKQIIDRELSSSGS